MQPTIDTEFQSLVHPLTHEEKAGLEQQLISDGCLDPLRVWQEENILLDGHNRFDLCTLHNIPFNVEYLSLKNRDAAMLWIVCNQLSRRNSTEEQKSYLRGKRYELEKRQEHCGENQYTKNGGDQNDPHQKTAEKIAQEFNVSAPTIKRDEQFAKGVDAIARVAPEVKQEILSGKSDFTKQEVRSMSTVMKQAEHDVRSQTILTTEDEIQKRIDAESQRRAKEQFDAILAQKKKPHVSNNSGENEWYTPQEFIEAAREVLGEIDLDPASSEIANQTVKAKRFFSIDDNGLSQEWSGKVWMNPPYESGLIMDFCLTFAKFYGSFKITEGIVLVNNATETAWFKELVSVSKAVVFPSRRIRFLSPDGKIGAPLQGQAILYAGPNKQKFLSIFKPFGWGAIL
jgi:phage N-6-adenine-methyltransferase